MQHPQQVSSKKLLKIHDIAEALNIKKFVIKLWEKEFGFDTEQPKGGQRLYSSQDLKIFQHIKELLHKQSMSIEEARLQIAQLYQVPATAATALSATTEVAEVVEEAIGSQDVWQAPLQEPIVSSANTYSAASQTTLSDQEVDAAIEGNSNGEMPEGHDVPALVMEELSALSEAIQPAAVPQCCANTKEILAGMQEVKERLLVLRKQLTKEG